MDELYIDKSTNKTEDQFCIYVKDNEGKPVQDAAREAARLRFRPVLMTAFSFILGVMPLVFATGPFTSSPIPMVSRYAVCGVSPLTGFWGEATSGGKFPFRLKGCPPESGIGW